jgi:hypothetical protein
MHVISLVVWMRGGFDAIHVHTPPDLTVLFAIFYQVFGKKLVFNLHDQSRELYFAPGCKTQSNAFYHALRFFKALACRRADRLIEINETQPRIQTGCITIRLMDDADLRRSPGERARIRVENG